MRSLSRAAALGATIVGIGVIAACDREPQRTTTGPSPTAQPVIVSVEISGPGSIPPNQSAQFTAVARLSDGTRQTAANARWFSDIRMVQIDASGLATAGHLAGEATLSVEVMANGTAPEYQGARGALRSSKEILILPEGTYRMAGVVTENISPAMPIFGARVEVVGGMPNVATTDHDGRYRLYGVPGIVEIRVTQDGYQPHVQRLQLAEHTTQNFQLALSGTRLDLSGSYTLTVDAACSTSTPVPADLRHRSYGASLTQRGSTVEVLLTESSRFRVNSAQRGARFTGRVDAAGATFNLGENFFPYYGPYDPSTYPTVVERLPDGTFLSIDGVTRIGASGGGLSGDLQGFLAHHDTSFPSVPLRTLGSCYSTAHRFTLTPR